MMNVECRMVNGVAGGAATGGTRMGGQTVQRFYEPTMQQSNGTMSNEVTR